MTTHDTETDAIVAELEKAGLIEVTVRPDGQVGYILEARGLWPDARVTVLARSDSTDSLTPEGPRGRATLGIRPAGLIRFLLGEPDSALFHRLPRPPR